MKLFARYIGKELLLLVLATCFTLTSIIWLSQALRYISLIVNSGVGFLDFIQLVVLVVPSLLNVILPISIFVSVVYLYHKLVMDGELIVLSASGLSKAALARPVIMIAILATIFNYLISLYLQPASYRELKDKKAFYQDNYASVMLEEGVFNNKIKGLTIYIDERDKEGTLQGVFVYDTRDINKPITMMAKTGTLSNINGTTYLKLYNGNRQEVNEDGQVEMLFFESFIYDIALMQENTAYRWRDPQERFIYELFSPTDTQSPAIKNMLRAEGHNRLVWPLYNIMLAFIGLIAVYPTTFNRRGQSKRIFIASLIAILVVISSVILGNVIAHIPAFTPIMYVLVLLVIVLEIRLVLVT